MKALVLHGDGINCEAETAFALELAGFEPDLCHTSELLEQPARLDDAGMLAIPGGFSYGDEIQSGRVLALKLRERLQDALAGFTRRGRLTLGICNGFQVLVQLGVLPGESARASLLPNRPRGFQDRWVDLEVDASVKTPYFEGMDRLSLPVRHGEGRLEVEEQGRELALHHAPLRYAQDVNGSFERVAALTDSTGNVLGLMPHPEAFVRWTQHPEWTGWRFDRELRKRLEAGLGEDPHGLQILKNARRALGS